MKFIALSIKSMSSQQKELAIITNKANINEFVDIVYSTEDDERNEEFKPKGIDNICKAIGTNTEILKLNSKFILEA